MNAREYFLRTLHAELDKATYLAAAWRSDVVAMRDNPIDDEDAAILRAELANAETQVALWVQVIDRHTAETDGAVAPRIAEDELPAATVADTELEKRARWIAEARAMLDLIESTPALPLPLDCRISAHPGAGLGLDDEGKCALVDAAAAVLGTPVADARAEDGSGGHYETEIKFGKYASYSVVAVTRATSARYHRVNELGEAALAAELGNRDEDQPTPRPATPARGHGQNDEPPSTYTAEQLAGDACIDCGAPFPEGAIALERFRDWGGRRRRVFAHDDCNNPTLPAPSEDRT